jgi:hypothetical protein
MHSLLPTHIPFKVRWLPPRGRRINKAEVNQGHAYACWDDLSQPCQKAEAPIPIIVLAFAGFNSSNSGFKFVVQDMVGWLLFYDCTKFLNFTIKQTNSAINLTHEAKNYLHGHYVKDMVGPCEEAFLKFTAMMEMMRYHCDDLIFLSTKYSPLFSPDDINTLATLVSDYDGEIVTNKAIKGHRTKDICRFVSMRSITAHERKQATTLSPFQFSYPEESEMKMKIEPPIDKTINAPMTMTLDEDDDFDYSSAKIFSM